MARHVAYGLSRMLSWGMEPCMYSLKCTDTNSMTVHTQGIAYCGNTQLREWGVHDWERHNLLHTTHYTVNCMMSVSTCKPVTGLRCAC